MHPAVTHTHTHTLQPLHELQSMVYYSVHLSSSPLLATTWLLSAAGGGVKGHNIYTTMQMQMGLSRGGCVRVHVRACVCMCVREREIGDSVLQTCTLSGQKPDDGGLLVRVEAESESLTGSVSASVRCECS